MITGIKELCYFIYSIQIIDVITILLYHQFYSMDGLLLDHHYKLSGSISFVITTVSLYKILVRGHNLYLRVEFGLYKDMNITLILTR